MAHVLRLKLQALYCPRLLSSPPLASKILDPRHIPWRCYAENALLEESCNSTLNANEIDGNSKAANGGRDSITKGDGVEDKASKELDLDKLTNSICDKLRAKANMVCGDKDKGFQSQQDPLLTKESKKADKDDHWQQVVRTVRTMVLKNKAKADASEKSGVPKTEANEDQEDFSDLDLPEAGGESGVSRGPNASHKDSLVMNAFGKSLKQKTRQLQYPHQQKSKDTKLLSFLDSCDNNTALSSQASQLQFSHQQKTKDTKPLSSLDSFDNYTTLSSLMSADDSTSDFFPATKPSNFQDKNQLRNNIAMPGSVSKMSQHKNNALPRAAADGSSAQVRDQSSCKGTAQFSSDFKGEGSGNDSSAQLHGKIFSCASEVTPQASGNDPHTGYMVCVQNLPSNFSPAVIKASMAVHGEVSGFFKKAVRNDYFNVYIQFKTAQSMEGALAARKLQIGGKSFLVARTDQVFSTVVRLSKVTKDTPQKQLLSICRKYGSVDNIRYRATGVYDVFYEVKELPNMTRILESLNEVTHNRSAWFAQSAPTLHPSVQKEALKNPEWQAWHEIQVSQALNRMEAGIDGVSVLFEDLKELTALGKEFSKR